MERRSHTPTCVLSLHITQFSATLHTDEVPDESFVHALPSFLLPVGET